MDVDADMTTSHPEAAPAGPGDRPIDYKDRHPDWRLDDSLGVLLSRLIRSAGLLGPGQPLLGEPVSLSEAFALAELAGDAPLSQRDLAERLGLEKSTVSRLVAGLERSGQVSRERDPVNRRFYRITLTGKGRSTAERLVAGMRQRHAQILGAMTEAEREALTVGVAALLRSMGQVPPVESPPSATATATAAPEGRDR
jgi:DNA-binding MarR family transcriptional regulator